MAVVLPKEQGDQAPDRAPQLEGYPEDKPSEGIVPSDPAGLESSTARGT